MYCIVRSLPEAQDSDQREEPCNAREDIVVGRVELKMEGVEGGESNREGAKKGRPDRSRAGEVCSNPDRS